MPATTLMVVAVSGLVGSAAGAAAPAAANDEPSTTFEVGLPPTTSTDVVVDVAVPPTMADAEVDVATPPLPPLPDTGGDDMLAVPAVDVATPPVPTRHDVAAAIAGAVAATAGSAWRNG